MSAGRATIFAPIDFKTRFAALDGVRALAITAVFAAHYGGGAHGGHLLNILNDIRRVGWVGVDLFFVLSGFLITGILYDTQADSHFFKRFFARRAVRIFPVYYFVFLLLLLLTPLVHFTWHWLQLSFLVYLGNFFGNANFSFYDIPARNPLATGSIAHFWSLCVEEQFYFLWPLVVWKVRRRVPLLWTAAALSVLALVLRFVMEFTLSSDTAQTWIVRTLPFRMDAMLIGAMMALLLRGPDADRLQKSCKWVLLASLIPLAVIVHSSIELAYFWMQTLGLTFTALASAGLIGWALREGSLAYRVFHVRPLRFLGRYSYGFYVYHVLFPKLCLWMLGFWILHLGNSRGLGGVVALPLNFALILLVSIASYKLLERPFLRLKTRFEYDAETDQHQHAFRT